ncbi:hypothetical protein BUALT_Bualt17G0024100 [Buddleja alternifolia]|uniref:Pentatricopeptide repeat-containing protein n=1 Tax=Buddleja alternifolia TaxID=168488 RepID=A0AAV6W5S2_9LAMI|nr:hypothetical protein BUALT_Bualt17G0024100 [Buddleja alternifolia]
MAEGLRSLEQRKELEALREQVTANAAKSDKMFEDIRNMIAAMAANQNPRGSAASMEQEDQSPMARGQGTPSHGYQLPTKRSKVEFPRFNGEDLRGWLFRAEQFFEVDETPVDTRVRLAAVYLEGKALQWHQVFMRSRVTREFPTWLEYVMALQDRFGSLLFEDPMSELMNLRQTGSVRDYLDKFDELLNNVDLNEPYAISCFLAGLKNEIEVQVRMFKPKSLQEAVSLAKLQEQAIFLAQKRQQSNTKTQYSSSRSSPILPTPSYSSFPNPLPNYTSKSQPDITSNNKQGRRLTPQEIDEKRAKGLCFLCDEKYTREHVCAKKRQLFLMEIQDDNDEDIDCETPGDDTWDKSASLTDIPPQTNFHISMNAMNDCIRGGDTMWSALRCRALSSSSSSSSPSIITDLSSELFSLLAQPNWQKHPSFRKLIPTISPSLFSSFISQHPHLNPQIALNFFNFLCYHAPTFKPNAQSYASLLRFLIKNKSFGNAEKTRRLMVKSCQTNEDAGFVLSVLRQLNRECSFRLSLRCYNMLLMSLARFLMIDDMKCVYREMLDDKVSPNIYTFNTMINAFCKLGNVGEAEMYLSMILQAGLKPDSHTYTSFILGHCRRKDVDSANHVFVSMPQKGCRRNEVSYNNLMHGLCEVGRVDEAKSLFLQMRDDNCFPNVRTYTILIDALCGLDRRLEALSLFEEMKEKGCEPNVHTYTVVIDGTCKDGMIDEARRLLSAMLDNRLVPSVVTYNALINGYCKKGMVDAAYEIFDMMELKNCSPNVRTYNELISGFCEVNKVQKAMTLLSKMLEQKLSPNVVTFNILVYGQCKEGDVDSAFRLLTLMEESNVIADQLTYGPLIDTLCKKGSVDKANEIFDSLKEKGIKVNEVMYTALIDGYCNVEKFDFALALFERMLAEGCLPNSYTYNVLIHGLCKVKKLPEALNFLERMLEGGMKPSIVTYSIVIEHMLKDFDFECAYRVLNHMIALGYKPDVCTYTSFLVAYCNRGMLREAEDVMRKMKEEGVLPDLMAYTVLIDGYGRSGFLSLAFDTFKSMVDAEIEPSHYTYSVIIKHLSHEKLMNGNEGRKGLDLKPTDGFINIADVWKIMEHDTALKLFEKMKEHGCAPNTNTYNALITGLCREGRLEEAWRLVDHLKQCGMSPNEDMYIKLVNCCCKMKNYGEAMNLIDAMLQHGLLPYLESFKLLICGLYETGNDEKAKSTFCRLLQCGFNYDEVVWKVLIDGLLQRGFVERCSELDKTLVTDLSARGASGYFAMLDLQKLTSVHFMSQDLGQYLTNERPGMLFFNTEAIGVLVAHDLKRGEFVLQVPFCPPQQKFEDFSSRLFNLLSLVFHQHSLKFVMKFIMSFLSSVGSHLQIGWQRAFRLKCAGCKAMDDAYAEVAEKFLAGNNRIILAGEAAHRFPPAGGFGMNTGIQDGHNLAWKLDSVLKGVAPPSILSTYETERRHFVNDVERIDREELIGRLQAMEETMSVFMEDQTQMKSSISALQNQMVELLKGMNILTGAHAAAATTNPVRRPRHLNANGHFVPRKPRISSLPSFNGTDPMGWLARVDQHFDIYPCAENQNIQLSMVVMEGSALH